MVDELQKRIHCRDKSAFSPFLFRPCQAEVKQGLLRPEIPSAAYLVPVYIQSKLHTISANPRPRI